MNDVSPMFELLIWDAKDVLSAKRVLDWLQTQPNKDIVGYIQIGHQRPRQISHRNRHTWEKILLDIISDSMLNNSYGPIGIAKED